MTGRCNKKEDEGNMEFVEAEDDALPQWRAWTTRQGRINRKL
jgi:hypothetical protein